MTLTPTAKLDAALDVIAPGGRDDDLSNDMKTALAYVDGSLTITPR